MTATIDLDLLARFAAVAESSSFSAAARRLRLPKSSVSRAVARLEAQLGTQLLHRTTRHVALSAAGAALYQRIAPLLGELAEAVGTLPERDEHPSGTLRITAPPDLAATLLAEITARFTSRYPSVNVEALVTNRTVDLVAEGVDLALRGTAGRLEDSTLVARRLSAVEFQVFAAPAYVSRRGLPRSPDDAAGHDWVAFRGWRGAQPLMAVMGQSPRVLADDFFFMREAVRAGAGLGLLPSFLAQPDTASGQLVRVWPRYAERSGALFLVYPRARHVPRKVAAFRDLVLEVIAVRPLAP